MAYYGDGMNEKITELYEQAYVDVGGFVGATEHMSKFAELIVRECLKMCKTAVGNKDYNTGRMHCYDNIKEHFGVEE